MTCPQNTVSQTIAHLEHLPKKVSFACAPFIFRSLGVGLLLSFQEENPEITLERMEMSDKDVDDYVGADETHFGMLAIPENRHGARFDYKSRHCRCICLSTRIIRLQYKARSTLLRCATKAS